LGTGEDSNDFYIKTPLQDASATRILQMGSFCLNQSLLRAPTNTYLNFKRDIEPGGLLFQQIEQIDHSKPQELQINERC
jgi:hypothetical protein